MAIVLTYVGGSEPKCEVRYDRFISPASILWTPHHYPHDVNAPVER